MLLTSSVYCLIGQQQVLGSNKENSYVQTYHRCNRTC